MLELPLEIWKDIPGFEGYYQVSTMGNVRSVERYVNCVLSKKHVKSIRHVPSKLLTKNTDSGYARVFLYENGKARLKLVHRLVALTFLPNPNNLPEVNHKDENPLNNELSNLEWCSRDYNQNYGTRCTRIAEKNLIPIVQLTLEGEFIRFWSGSIEVERQCGFNNSNINACCRGKHKTAYGYKWKYYEKGN